jgi:hypothetical protein
MNPANEPPKLCPEMNASFNEAPRRDKLLHDEIAARNRLMAI